LKEKLRSDVVLRFEIAEVAASGKPVSAAAAPKSAPAPKGAVPVKKNADDFKNDPLIQKALEVFKGTIVEVRK
jgi:hypothetical protein